MSSKPSSGPSKTRSSASRTRKAPSTRTKTARTGTGMEQPVDEAVQDEAAPSARKATTRRRTASSTRKKAATPATTAADAPADDKAAPNVEQEAEKPGPTTRRRTTRAATKRTTGTGEGGTVTADAAEMAGTAAKPARRTRRKTAAASAGGDETTRIDDAPAAAEGAETTTPARTRKTATRSTTSSGTKKTSTTRRTKAGKAGNGDDTAPVAPEDDAQETAKPTRTRRKRTASTTNSESTPPDSPAADGGPVDDAGAAAVKPVRRRTSRKKATTGDETPAEVAGSDAEKAGTASTGKGENAAAPKAAPAKPARRRTTKKTEAETTGKASALTDASTRQEAEEEKGKNGEADPGETDGAEPDGTPRFTDLALSPPILRAVEEMGYVHPTPIQAQAIPEVLAGHDVLGVAQTGTGKTASFTLPLLEKLSRSRARARMPRSLILEPTRELALQVAENFEQYGAHLRLTHALLIGGGKINEQRELLNRGVDVLIATPGRLLDMFERGGLLMTQTDLLVIDEADRMLDMGFIPDIERIVSLLPRQRQTLFFSATMAPEIRRLADDFLTAPKEITVARQSSVASTITEGLLVVEKKNKNRALCAMLRQDDVQNAIIFCNRKRDVDTLQAYLSRQKFAVGHLHGDLTQSLRFETLEQFRAGELKLLVCSDVAARGIDIGGLSHVFNYDLPFNAEDYVHRIGRTGRAGKEGKAYSLATPDEHKLLEAVETLTGKTIEPLKVRGFPSLGWQDDEERTDGTTGQESGKRGRKGKTASKTAPEGSKASSPEGEERPSRRKQAERAPLPEARKHDHRRSGRAELLPPVPEKNGLQDGFGDNVPAFMKVSFIPGPRDPSDS